MKKLYYVEITGYVAAENKQEAKEVVEFNLLRVDGMTYIVSEADSVDDSWKNALPYIRDEGQVEHLTCKQILEQRAPIC